MLGSSAVDHHSPGPQATASVKISNEISSVKDHSIVTRFDYDKCQSKLREFVYREMPMNVIKLPEMKLMERAAVVDYLSTKLEEYLRNQDSAENVVGSSTAHNLVDNFIKENGRFAILSHTWGKEELSYKDMRKQRNLRGQGYEKLKNFCTISHTDYGVEFGWMDTVCIDKSSSVELDESIRSMFAWYQESYVCIVHLAGSRTLADVAHDRWFTRGWTLQELLAPTRIRFYGTDWHPLVSGPRYDKGWDLDTWLAFNRGRESPILPIVAEAAGVDLRVIRLKPFRPDTSVVSTPMKWIARRNTTRGEDKAYCMMGLFGVSISIAYGEGAQRAFFRLFEAILKVSNSPDLFSWAGEPVNQIIHPSRMIPSSAKCYLNTAWLETAIEWTADENAVPVEPATLTSLGMRMTMLLVPVELRMTPRNSSMVFSTEAECTLSKQDLQLSWFTLPGETSSWPGDRPEYRVAIWNIKPTTRPVPSHAAAVLLRRWPRARNRERYTWHRVLMQTSAITFDTKEGLQSKTVDELKDLSITIETLYL
ncbi:hypothetical protein F5I97DRAFT_1671165 [Phlebopus sp. FC_14]|nr:hypothetical protein F5I97DRAFT_1671165 [Phlebopus sp. FC_14]